MSAGPVVWITGLSGAGKSSVAGALAGRLRDEGRRPILLDGDELRSALGTTGFSGENRRRLAATYARLCRMLCVQGHIVVCATISLQHEIHDWNREHLPRYVEVFLDVPLTELRGRDPKGIYRGGTEIVGLGVDAEFPVAPDLHIHNHGSTTAGQAAAELYEFCARKGMW
ncbi:adenylyl-sulfate kinase [Amycolatopsis acidicola]|uniref:Adenylyl-sulfate kinase n=1 Tax=Amycolatopsis acidicola TaxID=2596893 RepID=A0A5N0UVU0_9PSEU|nr:adenylyl-sulfate kinase [Amycolatopsis acidicola]KAA9155930.1 adenylyl-sulfate kinase [Amycolatopsis acidicola]